MLTGIRSCEMKLKLISNITHLSSITRVGVRLFVDILRVWPKAECLVFVPKTVNKQKIVQFLCHFFVIFSGLAFDCFIVVCLFC